MADVWHDWGQISEFLRHSREFLPPDDEEDQELLLAAVLIHSYALAESAAATQLGLPWRELGPIESWGEKLLTAQGKRWSKVSGGLRGAVEVAVIRNVLAHGQRKLDDLSVDRLVRAGAEPDEVVRSVQLDHASIGMYRGRLQSLLNHAAVGA